MERLLYVADPMCSWCWGFAPVLERIESELRGDVPVRLVLGGLAPDDDAPMPAATRRYVQSAWRAVAARTGATFDHSFWERSSPRRSTWPACRAVLAAGDRGREMFHAIQSAYYTRARDPSDRATLVAIAGELGFDEAAFADAIDAPETLAALEEDFHLRDRVGAPGFPSLALERDGELDVLSFGFTEAEPLLDRLASEGLLRPPATGDALRG